MLNDDLERMVQKANPLFAICQTDLTLEELKLVDLYLARINIRDKESRKVVFEKGEIEQILGVKRTRNEALRNRLEKILGLVVTLGKKTDSGAVEQITIFSMAHSYRDKNEQWHVEMVCSPEAMDYLFDIEKSGYYRYKIKKIVPIKSRTTYVLYQYFLFNKFFHRTWIADVDELKDILNCRGKERYDEFKYFSRDVINKGCFELEEYKCIKCEWEPIRAGRKVSRIKFTIKNLFEDKVETESVQPKDADEPLDQSFIIGSSESFFERIKDEIDYLMTACENKFSRETIEYLYSLNIPAEPDITLFKAGTEDWYAERLNLRYHYLSQMYMKLKSLPQPIKNQESYFRTMVENDLESKKEKFSSDF